MEAIGHAGTCLGILANDGVLLAAERRNIHKLLDEVFFSEKIYKLNEWVVVYILLSHILCHPVPIVISGVLYQNFLLPF